MFISLWLLIREWASVQDKCACARALVIHSIYGQQHAYTKPLWLFGMDGNPQFFSSYSDRVRVKDVISCLIWPLSISCHHHIDLGTQSTKLHIMTSAYLWIYMTLIFEHYLAYLCSMFSQVLVCYSWDYGLYKLCLLFLDRMLGSCQNFQLNVKFAKFVEHCRNFAYVTFVLFVKYKR